MSRKFLLDAKQILDKQFHIDLQGYSTKEVDSFLDMIINDYQEYDGLVKELGEHLNKYEEENQMLKKKIALLEKQVEDQEQLDNEDASLYDNLDIIKRISRLEKEVFKK